MLAAALCVLAICPPGSVASQQSGSQTTPSGSPSPSPTSGGQTQPGTTTTTTTTVPPPAHPKKKLDRYKGHVLVFNLATIVVQSSADPRFIWSFQYSPELRAKVIELLNTGGYRHGDRVQVYCNPGTTIAVKIKGKPSGSASS